ncbi:hypothetical protein [Rhizobium leguminosarum]|uniref:hypothetical protein n=1 Tax=Rhizobium leguminosarum TaxID=384 RepID=UPI001C94E046|nr:hypothetical protein [Rhizobium leguminosarum]MBY5698418.1 hypothetical protein [Rhizobium leguminosarum]
MNSYTDESGFDGVVPAHPAGAGVGALRHALMGIQAKSLLIEVAMRDCFGYGSAEHSSTVNCLKAVDEALATGTVGGQG